MNPKKLITVVCVALGLLSCDKNTDEGGDISGTYLLSGSKIRTQYPVWPPTMGEQPTIDTVPVSYTVRIEKASSKKDSIRFFGLEEANVVYEEGPNCSTDYYCGVYARIIDNHFEFDLHSPGGDYTGTGTIAGDSIIFNTKYRYRPTTYQYILKGKKQ